MRRDGKAPWSRHQEEWQKRKEGLIFVIKFIIIYRDTKFWSLPTLLTTSAAVALGTSALEGLALWMNHGADTPVLTGTDLTGVCDSSGIVGNNWNITTSVTIFQEEYSGKLLYYWVIATLWQSFFWHTEAPSPVPIKIRSERAPVKANIVKQYPVIFLTTGTPLWLFRTMPYVTQPGLYFCKYVWVDHRCHNM